MIFNQTEKQEKEYSGEGRVCGKDAFPPGKM